MLMQAGLGQRQHDPEEDLVLVGPVDDGRLMQLRRQRLEEAGQEEDAKGQRIGHVDQDQPLVGVEHPQPVDQKEERNQRQEDREEHTGQEAVEDDAIAGKGKAGQHIGRHGRQRQDQHQRRQHHDEAVEKIVADVGINPAAHGSCPIAGAAGSDHGLKKISWSVLNEV